MGVRIQNEETVTELWLSLMAEGRRMHRRYSNNRGITFGLTRPDGRDILMRRYVFSIGGLIPVVKHFGWSAA